MNTEIMRQNLIDSIMNLDAGNPYKKQLLKIVQYHKEGRFTDTEAYLLINNVVVSYDFNKIIPKEQNDIEKQRNQELNRTLSNVPIQNPDDITEVALKTKIQIGQIFANGQKELIKTIGVKNLNMKNRNGDLITDLEKISKGKRKKQAYEIIKQYCDIQQRADLKRYSLQVTDIFEYPYYIEKDDKRGKSGFYIQNLMPIVIYYLMRKTDNVIYTTIDELSYFVGLVTSNYKKMSLKELVEINPKFTNGMLNQFYCRCKPELEKIIFRTLDSLQDDYRVLNYYRNYCIITNDGCYTSSKNDDVIIRQIERKVLKEFNTNRIFTIFRRNQQKQFYNRVCEMINETYGFDWIRYKKQIQIFKNSEELQEVAQDLADHKITNEKEIIASRFAKRIMKKTESDYNRTNRKADNAEIEWVKEQLNQPEIKELSEIGFDYEEDFKKIFKSFDNTFRYHESYLEIQNELIKLMIGEPETEVIDNIPEIEGIMQV